MYFSSYTVKQHDLFMQKQTKPVTSGDNIPQKKKKQISIKEKVRKHITDINDVISDEDIRDAQPDTGIIAEEIDKKEFELEQNAEVNEGNEKEEEKKPVTPWDVLNE
jgi:hypothetical protein